MFVYSNFNNRRGGGLGCLIFGVLGLVVAYYILKGLFALLWWAAPFLFVLTLLINWRVVGEAGAGLLNLIRRQPLSGLIVAVLAAVAFPITALYLFLSAVGSRGRRTQQESPFREEPSFDQPSTPHNQKEGEFIDFEEIREEEPLSPPEPPKKEPQQPPANPYNDLFK
ncbi:MAG TPA: hypothetical protein PLW66_01200 [Saprospiraceae bacterium]|nr:hypothetical protein [Saprospiraceae bacterium]